MRLFSEVYSHLWVYFSYFAFIYAVNRICGYLCPCLCLQREEYCRSVQDGQIRSQTPSRQTLDTGVSIRQLVSTSADTATTCVCMNSRKSMIIAF